MRAYGGLRDDTSLVAVDLTPGLTLSLGASYQFQSGRDQVTPLKTAASGSLPAVYAGPATSAADVNATTVTLGLKWKY